ncbi:calcium:proton antiporter [Humitalea sp. 24SJ18S-53]|uniref:calcium:proton antiporter n=1 Tax=Humitalea sp. 24SJ18S-53 TaxID=3422307 RepID=UPI003D6765DA
MAGSAKHGLPWWSWVFPILALGLVLLHPDPLGVGGVVMGLALIGAVFAGVHHAEVVAHRIGEPFGSLVLAVAVTVIEAGLIVSMMLGGGKETVARDSVFAALMIALNGIVGLALVLGGARYLEQGFQARAAAAYLAVLAAMATLTLVLPNYTASTPGPVFNTAQLVFVSVVSLVLYVVFLFVQTVRHREYFLPEADDADGIADPPSLRATWMSAGLMLPALVGVVLLAKFLAPAVEAGVAAAAAPVSVVGVAIAALVLLPEGFSAVRAARRNRLQTSLNLALGSVIACIGLTIPVVAVVAIWLGQPLVLGLRPSETVLLVLTLFTAGLTLGSGRTTVLQGAVHLVIFAAFLFMAVVP